MKVLFSSWISVSFYYLFSGIDAIFLKIYKLEGTLLEFHRVSVPFFNSRGKPAKYMENRNDLISSPLEIFM